MGFTDSASIATRKQRTMPASKSHELKHLQTRIKELKAALTQETERQRDASRQVSQLQKEISNLETLTDRRTDEQTYPHRDRGESEHTEQP